MNFISSTEKFLHKVLGNGLDFDLRSYLIKGSFFSILIQIFSMALNFFIGILLARLIGADGYGAFTYAFTLLSVICTIAVFGMDDLLVREISTFQSQNNFSGIKAIMRWAIIRTLIFSAFISMVFFILVNFTEIVSPDKKSIFNLILLCIPVFTLLMILQASKRGLHQVISGQFPEKIIRPVVFILAIFTFIFFYGNTISSLWGINLNIIAHFIAFFILAFQSLKIFNITSEEKIIIPRLWSGKEARSSFYFFIATIMAVINVRADILMLEWMKSDTEVGIYNVAARFSDFTAFALLIITPIIAPSISRLNSLNEKIKLQQLVTKAAKANFIFALSITILLVITGKYPLGFFGDEFTQGYFCMLLLCGGQLITTFAGPAGNLLLMTGFEKLAFYSGLAGTVINILLNLLLIPEFGINGAAAAPAFSMFVWNGLQTFFIFKKLKINPTVLISNP